MKLKTKVHQYYLQLVQDKIDVFQDMIYGLSIDAANDSKSSAGDKHQTSLSMMHLEQEKLNHKLAQFIDQKNILNTLDYTKIHQIATVGSLVQTNSVTVYISTALPKIQLDNQTIFAISPQSALGSGLLNKKIGETITVNNSVFTIQGIE